MENRDESKFEPTQEYIQKCALIDMAFRKEGAFYLAYAAKELNNRADGQDAVSVALAKSIKSMPESITEDQEVRKYVWKAVRTTIIDIQKSRKLMANIDEVEGSSFTASRMKAISAMNRDQDRYEEVVENYKSKLVPRLKRHQPLILREVAIMVHDGVLHMEAFETVAKLVITRKGQEATKQSVKQEWFRIGVALDQVLAEDRAIYDSKNLQIAIGKDLTSEEVAMAMASLR